MSVMDPEARALRARCAALKRSRPDDDPDLQSARRDFAANRLAAHVQNALDAAPPLTPEQRERIAALLHVNPQRPQANHADLGLVDTSPNDVGGDV